ncbi:MAG: hypothetical protein HXY53_04800 [Nitrospirae bacterium]|nr:hypothetical protein [Nitrospirota bacterium]
MVDDYKRLFNEDPPLIEGIRVQINSQRTHSRSSTTGGLYEYRQNEFFSTSFIF